MNRGSTWCKKRAEAVCGAGKNRLFCLKNPNMGDFCSKRCKQVIKTVDEARRNP